MSRRQGSGARIGKIAHQQTIVVLEADVIPIVSVVFGAAVIADSDCCCCCYKCGRCVSLLALIAVCGSCHPVCVGRGFLVAVILDVVSLARLV